MSFIAVAGLGLSAIGTGIQMGASNKAANDQMAESRRQDQNAFKAKGQADLDRQIATLNLQAQYDQNKGIREEQLGAFTEGLGTAEEFAGNQLAQMRQLGSQGLPDAAKAFMMQQAQRAASAGIAGAEDARGGLGGAARAQQGLKDTYTELASMDAQQRIQNQRAAAQAEGQYGNTMQNIAGARFGAQTANQNWQEAAYNQAFIDPQMQTAAMGYGEYNRARDYSAALEGSAIQNKAQMWNQLGQGLTKIGGAGIGAGLGGLGGGGEAPPTPNQTSAAPQSSSLYTGFNSNGAFGRGIAGVD